MSTIQEHADALVAQVERAEEMLTGIMSKAATSVSIEADGFALRPRREKDQDQEAAHWIIEAKHNDAKKFRPLTDHTLAEIETVAPAIIKLLAAAELAVAEKIKAVKDSAKQLEDMLDGYEGKA